jgi:hypothetical protein
MIEYLSQRSPRPISIPSTQGPQGTIAMPAVTIHGHPIATAAPATEARDPHECLSVRAGGGGRGWAGVGGGGSAAIRKYIMGHVGLCPLPVGTLKIAGNLIYQSNQKDNRHSK